MKFDAPLHPARLVRRYKRFFVDARLEATGEPVTALCTNTGRMTGIVDPGLRIWLADRRERGGKLDWGLELVEVPGPAGAEPVIVGCNTSLPNGLVEEAIVGGVIVELAGYDAARREVKYGDSSRIDLLLDGKDGRRCYVEVKNVHMRRDERPFPSAAEFPDAVTARGAKHLRELVAMAAEGHRAVMVYLVQRSDCDHFRIADDIDPAYHAALVDALANGVEALCYACRVTTDGVTVTERMPVVV